MGEQLSLGVSGREEGRRSSEWRWSNVLYVNPSRGLLIPGSDVREGSMHLARRRVCAARRRRMVDGTSAERWPQDHPKEPPGKPRQTSAALSARAPYP